MDPVTHLLAGYLLGYGLFGSGILLQFTVFMAFFPDLDTVSWLFPRAFRRLRHRGPTHSLVVGSAASAIGATAIALAAPDVAWWQAFAAGMVGFISHIGLDYLNWGCMILWPWQKRGVEFTVQQGLKGPLVASAVGFGAITLGHASGRATLAVAAVAVAWSAYLVAKLLLKTRLVARHAPNGAVYPTASPLRWRVIESRSDGPQGERVTRYREALFAPRLRERTIFTSRHRVTPPPLPLKTPEDAAAFTFLTREVQELAAADLALAVGVTADEAGGWVARWYALDYHRGDGCFGALVRVHPNGAYEARKGMLAFRPHGESAQ